MTKLEAEAVLNELQAYIQTRPGVAFAVFGVAYMTDDGEQSIVVRSGTCLPPDDAAEILHQQADNIATRRRLEEPLQ